MRSLLVLPLAASLLSFAVACGVEHPCAGTAAATKCGGGTEPDVNDDQNNDGDPPALVPVGSSEHDIGSGWIGAGQPSEERLREVVAAGARVISLRYADEDPYAEQAVVEELGGTFIRYPTESSSYQSVPFREEMYDLYDAQMALGGQVYLHCASSNRVGASWALYQGERKGLPAEEALELGRQAGLSGLEPMVRDILGVP